MHMECSGGVESTAAAGRDHVNAEGSITTASGGGGGGAGTCSGVGGARWNPTKEQINILERLYSERGIKTPSAEQIQQITSMLKVYGNIEGKNVFYWFQNHKARQRQKQKQEQKASCYNNIHYQQQQHQGFTPILPAPVLPVPPSPPSTWITSTNGAVATHPPFPTAMYNPYLPPSKLCYYPQYQPGCTSMINSGPMERSPVLFPPDNHHQFPTATLPPINYMSYWGGNNVLNSPTPMNDDNMTTAGHNNNSNSNIVDANEDKTLNLFPVHPTGILQEERKLSSTGSSSAAAGVSNSSSGSGGADDGHAGGSDSGRFIDFFSGRESSESD